MAAQLPLAAGLNGIEGILTLLFLLFWIVSQVRTLFGGAERGKPAGAGAPRPRVPQRDDEGHRELARQIDEFVRRASGEQPGPPAVARRELSGRQRGPAVTRRGPGASPPPPGTRRPTQPARSDAKTAPVPMHAAPDQPRELGSLGGHATDVARHVDDAFAREIPHLAVGGAVPTVAAAAAPTAAPGIAALLRDPATLGQLVLVREVLDRPVDRW